MDGSYDTVNREYTNDENKDKQTSAGLDNQINKKGTQMSRKWLSCCYRCWSY